ncbi:unnamed protein product [Durusdinium trenchii]|uniref:Uncharacterized protein n=1 Tax=Durusdinium trenchii TaxID=1381693 RepID=A0ABP0L740_9DINO
MVTDAYLVQLTLESRETGEIIGATGSNEEGKQRVETFTRLQTAFHRSSCATGLDKFQACLKPLLDDWVKEDTSTHFFIIVTGHGSQEGKLEYTSLGVPRELTPEVFWDGMEAPVGGITPYEGLSKILEVVPDEKLDRIHILVVTCYSNQVAARFGKPQQLNNVTFRGISSDPTQRVSMGGSTIACSTLHRQTEQFLFEEYGINVQDAVDKMKKA